MSNIIDEGLSFSESPSYQANINQSEYIPPLKVLINNNKDEIIKILVKFFNNLDSQFYIEPTSAYSKDFVSLKIVNHNLKLRKLIIMVNIKFNLKEKYIETYMTLLQGQKPYKIQTTDHRIMGSKIFSKSYLNNYYKLCLSIQNGTFKIIKPIIFSMDNNFIDIIQSKGQQISLINVLISTIKDCTGTCQNFLKLFDPNSMDDPIAGMKKYNEGISRTILRYITRSPIQPAFDVSFGSGKYDTMQWLTKQQILSTNNMFLNIITDFSEFLTHSLYVTPGIPLSTLKTIYTKQYFTFNDDQLNILKQKALPPISRMNVSIETKYIYNVIEMNENAPIGLKRISMGGFSQINKAEVGFWYILSQNNKKSQKSDEKKQFDMSGSSNILNDQKYKKIYKKWFVFKDNNFKAKQTGRNRIHHQMKIAAKFKGATSIFVPQYFKLNNQKSPYAHYLMMEYLPFPTLNQYFESNKSSMSILTKIYLASMIIQALRFLKNYEIVHMDLKPANIIITKRLIVKLIDFGESYNKQICDLKTFKPAFSMPYGSPEVYDGAGKEFNEKNDVYSWGIIIFQLLFKRLPYVFTRQQATKMFKEREYMNRLYFVPEEQDKYGSWQLMPLLRNIIFRALDPDIKNRPCTLWIIVVLKEFLNYLINFEMTCV